MNIHVRAQYTLTTYIFVFKSYGTALLILRKIGEKFVVYIRTSINVYEYRLCVFVTVNLNNVTPV